MCRIYLYILWTSKWQRSLTGQSMTDNQRKNLHWYHYYVIVDLYFHSYFQEKREQKKTIPKDKRWIFYTVFAYIRLSGSAQSFMVTRKSHLKVKKCKNGMFHTLGIIHVLFFQNRKLCDHRIFSYFFSRTWMLLYFCVDQSLQKVIYH